MCFANLFFHVILCCFKLSGLTHIVLWRQRNSFPPVGFISGDPCLTPSVSLDMAPWQHSSSSLTSMRSDPHLCHSTPSLPPWPTTVSFATAATQLDIFQVAYLQWRLDSAAVSIFVVILIKLTNTVFDNSTNITTNIETAVLSSEHLQYWCISGPFLHHLRERQHLNEQHWRLDVSHCGGWNLLQMTGYKLSPCNCIPQKRFTTHNIPALFTLSFCKMRPV